MEKVLIFIDSREIANGILDFFEQYDCEIQSKNLLCGDFIISDRVCIERKTVNDFISSITDKRLFQQLALMKENFEKPILLIEGEDSLYGTLQPNIIRGVVSSISIDYGIPIIWTRSFADTAGLIYWMAKREQILEKREVVFRNKKVPKKMEEKQEYFVSSLPDISVVRAKSLLKHFKSPQDIFNADEKELQKVEGIGKKIAKNIRKILEKKYKE